MHACAHDGEFTCYSLYIGARPAYTAAADPPFLCLVPYARKPQALGCLPLHKASSSVPPHVGDVGGVGEADDARTGSAVAAGWEQLRRLIIVLIMSCVASPTTVHHSCRSCGLAVRTFRIERAAALAGQSDRRVDAADNSIRVICGARWPEQPACGLGSSRLKRCIKYYPSCTVAPP